MRRVVVGVALSLLVLLPLAWCFSQSSNKRVFVSTPVSKFPKRLVGDCMTPSPLVLSPSSTVDEAMMTLLGYGLAGAPVVNGEELVGIVTSFDFLQKEAFEGSLLPIEGSRANVERYVDAARKICGKKVEDVMTTKDIVTVTPDASMREAAALMTEHKLHRLPVVEEGSRHLVGVLSSADVMRDLLHIARNLPAAKEEAEELKEEAEVAL